MVKRKIIMAVLSVFICFLLCGAGLINNTKVAIDTENNKVYKYCTADIVISAFILDSKDAKKTYKDKYVLLSGEVKDIGKNGKNIVLSGLTESDITINCVYSKELRNDALTYNIGDDVALYGQIKINIIDKDINLKVEKIVDIPMSIKSEEMYYLLDGSSFDKTNATKLSLQNGKIEYYVPSVWINSGIQHNLLDEQLGAMEGYQYVLNKLDADNTTPESLFICYFDNESQLADHLNDSDETELIEKAIVENILGSVGRFPAKEVETYYGDEYIYYTGTFKTTFDIGTGYHTEFIFQQDGEKGIVVLLYVYKDANHLSDVMFISRFLDIKNTEENI